MPLHISKMMVFLCVFLVFWHMVFFLNHSRGMFLHVFFVSVFQILEPSHFVEFWASFWVLFLVILGPVMEKTAKRNTLEKKTKKASASSPDESGKLQVWGGGPLIKQSKRAAPRTKPGPGPG